MFFLAFYFLPLIRCFFLTNQHGTIPVAKDPWLFLLLSFQGLYFLLQEYFLTPDFYFGIIFALGLYPFQTQSSYSLFWFISCSAFHTVHGVLKNTVVLEKTLESPLDCREIKPVHPKGNQSWIFIGKTDVEAETPILWPPEVKNWLIWKDPDAGKDWRWEEKETTEDEMVGWHHWLNGHEFE